jgi:hypothetical protein
LRPATDAAIGSLHHRSVAVNKTLLILSLGLAFALACRLQTVDDLSAKYPVVTSYEVRPGILMTPRYTADGQVCQMSIERQRATRSGVMLDSFMSDRLVEEIVDELAPLSERGKPARIGLELKTGAVTQTLNAYDDISYDVLDGPGRERAVVISWVHRTCKEEPERLPLQDYPR